MVWRTYTRTLIRKAALRKLSQTYRILLLDLWIACQRTIVTHLARVPCKFTENWRTGWLTSFWLTLVRKNCWRTGWTESSASQTSYSGLCVACFWFIHFRPEQPLRLDNFRKANSATSLLITSLHVWTQECVQRRPLIYVTVHRKAC